MARRKKRRHYGSTREGHETPARDLYRDAANLADEVKKRAKTAYGCDDAFDGLLNAERVFGKASAHQAEAEVNFELSEIRARRSAARMALLSASHAVKACLRKD